MVEDLETKLAELIDRIVSAGSDLAPEVISLAAASLYYDGLVQVVAAGAMTSIWLAIYLFAGRLCRRAVQDSDENATFVWGIVLGANTLFFGLLTLIFWLDGNPWLKVLNPEAALVKQLLL